MRETCNPTEREIYHTLTEAQVQWRVRRQAVRDTVRSEMKEATERDLQQRHAAENRELRSIVRAKSQQPHATPSMPWPDARDWVHQITQNFKFTVQGISEAGGLMQWRDMQTWLKNLIILIINTVLSDAQALRGGPYSAIDADVNRGLQHLFRNL